MEPTSLESPKTLNTNLSSFANEIFKLRYAFDENETWEQCSERVSSNVLSCLGDMIYRHEKDQITNLIKERKFIPGGRYLYSSGRPLHPVNNCFLVNAEDSREGWGELLKKAAMVLQMGGGLGVCYDDIRPNGSPIRKTGGVASGPVSLMQMVNEIGRGVMQGGSRRSALIALLDWRHADIFDFIHLKDWPEEVRKLKEKDFNFPAIMDMTNISVSIDEEFFIAYEIEDHDLHDHAVKVYDEVVKRMLKTAEPGFSVNVGTDEKLRNPCSEVVSADDSDCCNLGSINLSRIETLEEFREAIDCAIIFMLAGTIYSDIPYDKVKDVREKNRRLGLGLMGIHEWLLKRGLPYEPNQELGKWLEVYKEQSRESADKWSKIFNLNSPIAVRAIAPNGTIGIIGETTSGIEPIFCKAYKRRYIVNGKEWKYQYVVDPTAKRLVDQGVDPDDIEDAYSLSYNVERRVEFQAFVQQYVDQAISSTINIPYAITDKEEIEDFKDMLIKHLPELRGITCYPDGARGGQPLNAVPYEEAIGREGVVFEESEDQVCSNGVCGI